MLCPNCNKEFSSNFCPDCGYSTSTVPTPPPPAPTYVSPPPTVVYTAPYAAPSATWNYSPKNRWVAFFLCLTFGWLGVHRFYTGKNFTGLLYALTLGFGFLGVFFDLVTILAGSYTDKAGLFLTSQPVRIPRQ